MNRTILVPIDISDSELTQRVISHVEAEAKIDDAKVHFSVVNLCFSFNMRNHALS